MSSGTTRKKPTARAGTGGGSAWGETLRTVLYAMLIAVGIRTVGLEPFSIPSGSMIPTLLVGDYLFVSKYSYGYSNASLPFGLRLFEGRVLASMPERGDVAVFKLPRDGTTDYIKRVVALPGDRVQVRGGVLHVNGVAARRESLGPYVVEGEVARVAVRRWRETLPPAPGTRAAPHEIVEVSDDGPADNTPEYRVPPGHVFAMGDNRDNSQDSRFLGDVGYIPLENLVGRAEFVFFSWDGSAEWYEVWAWPFAVRWGRLLSAVR